MDARSLLCRRHSNCSRSEWSTSSMGVFSSAR
nr:MAG TPA: hypothetical protein [Caudoviricetes sp.]